MDEITAAKAKKALAAKASAAAARTANLKKELAALTGSSFSAQTVPAP